MHRIKEYLKSEYKVFIAVFYAVCTFGSIFLLADLRREFFWLGLEIIFFGMAVYLFVQWFQYQREESCKEAAERLDIENRRLQSQMVKERKELEEYFLLWVHQIKTPITVSNLLLRKGEGEQAAKLREQMFYIEEYTNMAMNYLKLRDRQSDMDIAAVKLDDIIKTLLKKYSMLFIEKHLSLEYEAIPQEVITDAKWLSILIEQILANALKYTEKGKITISYRQETNTLSIQDTGIGIRSEDLKKIFDRGYSGFNGRVNEKSSGLGLYLVKSIADILKIKVKVESVLREGSTFSLQFPSDLTKL